MTQYLKEGEDIKTINLSRLAVIAGQDWKATAKNGVYFGAVPYLQAMTTLDNMESKYGMDSASSIVNYFLSNAQSWRGEVAKAVKAELNRRLKNK